MPQHYRHRKPVQHIEPPLCAGVSGAVDGRHLYLLGWQFGRRPRAFLDLGHRHGVHVGIALDLTPLHVEALALARLSRG